MDYKNKYLKYKNKYLYLKKNIIGGENIEYTGKWEKSDIYDKWNNNNYTGNFIGYLNNDTDNIQNFKKNWNDVLNIDNNYFFKYNNKTPIYQIVGEWNTDFTKFKGLIKNKNPNETLQSIKNDIIYDNVWYDMKDFNICNVKKIFFKIKEDYIENIMKIILKKNNSNSEKKDLKSFIDIINTNYEEYINIDNFFNDIFWKIIKFDNTESRNVYIEKNYGTDIYIININRETIFIPQKIYFYYHNTIGNNKYYDKKILILYKIDDDDFYLVDHYDDIVKYNFIIDLIYNQYLNFDLKYFQMNLPHF